MRKRRWYERTTAMLLAAMLVINSEGLSLAARADETDGNPAVQEQMENQAAGAGDEAEEAALPEKESPSEGRREKSVKASPSEGSKKDDKDTGTDRGDNSAITKQTPSEAEKDSKRVVIGFHALQEEVQAQSLPLGSTENDITFPDRLFVTLKEAVSSDSSDDEFADGVDVFDAASDITGELSGAVLEDITWKLDKENSAYPEFHGGIGTKDYFDEFDENGNPVETAEKTFAAFSEENAAYNGAVYVYRAILPENVEWADDVEAPELYVTVGAAQIAAYAVTSGSYTISQSGSTSFTVTGGNLGSSSKTSLDAAFAAIMNDIADGASIKITMNNVSVGDVYAEITKSCTIELQGSYATEAFGAFLVKGSGVSVTINNYAAITCKMFLIDTDSTGNIQFVQCGGTVTCNDGNVSLTDNRSMKITGGTVKGDIEGNGGQGTFEMTGGTLEGRIHGVGNINISGGTIQYEAADADSYVYAIYPADGSRLTISGGTISAKNTAGSAGEGGGAFAIMGAAKNISITLSGKVNISASAPSDRVAASLMYDEAVNFSTIDATSVTGFTNRFVIAAINGAMDDLSPLVNWMKVTEGNVSIILQYTDFKVMDDFYKLVDTSSKYSNYRPVAKGNNIRMEDPANPAPSIESGDIEEAVIFQELDVSAEVFKATGSYTVTYHFSGSSEEKKAELTGISSPAEVVNAVLGADTNPGCTLKLTGGRTIENASDFMRGDITIDTGENATIVLTCNRDNGLEGRVTVTGTGTLESHLNIRNGGITGNTKSTIKLVEGAIYNEDNKARDTLIQLTYADLEISDDVRIQDRSPRKQDGDGNYVGEVSAITAYGPSKITITGGEISSRLGTGLVLGMLGSAREFAALDMSGGSISGKTYGIRQDMQAKQTVISGGTISGGTADVLLCSGNNTFRGKLTLKGELPFDTLELAEAWRDSGMEIDLTEAAIGEGKTLTVTLPWRSASDATQCCNLFTMKTSNYQELTGKIQIKTKTDALSPFLAINHTAMPSQKPETTGVYICAGTESNPTLVQYYKDKSDTEPFYREYVMPDRYFGDVEVAGETVNGWKNGDGAEVDFSQKADVYRDASKTVKLYPVYAVRLELNITEITPSTVRVDGTTNGSPYVYYTRNEKYKDVSGKEFIKAATEDDVSWFSREYVEKDGTFYVIFSVNANREYTIYFGTKTDNDDYSDVKTVNFTTPKLKISDWHFYFSYGTIARYTGRSISTPFGFGWYDGDKRIKSLESIYYRKKLSDGSYDTNQLSEIKDVGVYGMYVTTKEVGEDYENAKDLWISDYTIRKNKLEDMNDEYKEPYWCTLASPQTYGSSGSFVKFNDNISGYGTVTETLYTDDAYTQKAEKNVEGFYDAGTYYVTVEVSGGDNIEPTAAPIQMGRVVIDKADNEITSIRCGNITYGGTPQPQLTAKNTEGDVTFTYSQDLNGTYEEWNTANHAGEYYVKVSIGESKNYRAISEVKTESLFRVDKAKVTPTVSYIETKSYDGTTFCIGFLTLTAAEGSAIRPEDRNELQVSGDIRWTSKEAGTKTVNVTNIYMTAGWEERYELTVGELRDVSWEDACITPANLSVSVKQDGSLYYSGKPQRAGIVKNVRTADNCEVAFTFGTRQGEETLTAVPEFTDTGTYTVYYKATAPNHIEKTGSFDVTIQNAKLTGVRVESYSGTYDGLYHGIMVECTGDAADAKIYYGDTADTCTSTVMPAYKDVSSRSFYYRVEKENYDPVIGLRSIEITPAKLEVKAGGLEIAYGDVFPAESCGNVIYGFENGENMEVLDGTLTYTSNYTVGSDVGKYEIRPGGLTAKKGNYDITYTPGTLTVVQADAVFAIDNMASLNRVYNGAAVEAAVKTNSDGAVSIVYKKGDEVLTGAPKDVGSYKVLVSAAESKNVKAGNAEFAFEITKAPLKVIAENQTITAGAEAPEYTVRYEGLAGADTAASLGGSLAVSCDYTRDSQVGSYSIIPSGFTSDNYDITYVNGTLTVQRKASGSRGSGTGSGTGTPIYNPSSTGNGGSWERDAHGWWFKRLDGSYIAGTRETDADGRTHEYIKWELIGGKWWAFNADGYIKVGWVYDERTGIWYFINENAGMHTGWLFVDGFWYFFDRSGRMYANMVTPDGYRVDENGRWIP